jgi:hypothetical protein
LTAPNSARTFTTLRTNFQPAEVEDQASRKLKTRKTEAESRKPGAEFMSESASDWNTYRTRFLVRARQLTEPLTFTDPLGREHRGRPGDYLVQSSEGLLRIAPREIFEDVYVAMECEAAGTAPKSVFRSPSSEHIGTASAAGNMHI